ncbi:MAG TPA: hypothetical protein VF611_19885 [Pyrinomonadaceae bacterium]|jgi:hypothetical protein
MGFFSKLKKVVAGVDKGAAIAASVLPGKAGQVAGGVAQASGVVTAVVQQIQSKSGSELPPEEAQKQATLATAVAVDDHEERVKALEAELAALRAASAAQGGQTAQSGQQSGAGQTGQTGQSGASGRSGASGGSGGSGQSGQSGQTGQSGSSGGSGQS